MPQERRLGVTQRVLEAMCDEPPDALVVQTHSHRVTDPLDLYPRLAKACRLRFHVSIESDRDRLPGLVHEAERGGAVTITRRGKPVAVLISVAE